MPAGGELVGDELSGPCDIVVVFRRVLMLGMRRKSFQLIEQTFLMLLYEFVGGRHDLSSALFGFLQRVGSRRTERRDPEKIARNRWVSCAQ